MDKRGAARRMTFDRLVGPFRLETRDDWTVLVPEKLDEWRIEKAELERGLYQRVAALAADADDAVIAREASRLGLRGWVPGIRFGVTGRSDDQDAGYTFYPQVAGPPTASAILVDLRKGLAALAPPPAPPAHPILRFPEGDDPRGLWKMQQGLLDFLKGDNPADQMAECIRWCFAELARDAPKVRLIEERVAPLAEGWVPRDGLVSLFESARRSLSTAPGAHELWPYLVARVVVAREDADGQLVWTALCALTPLLLAGAEASGSAVPHRFSHLRHETVYGWRELAREARVWDAVIRELQKAGPRARWGGAKELGEAINELASAVFSLGEIRTSLMKVDASDGRALWRWTQGICADRMAEAGVSRAIPAGSLLGVTARVLFSVDAALSAEVKLCACGAEIHGRSSRCPACQRQRWREQKRAPKMRSPSPESRPSD